MIGNKSVQTKNKGLKNRGCLKEPKSATLKLRSHKAKENTHILPKVISNYDENPSERSE